MNNDSGEREIMKSDLVTGNGDVNCGAGGCILDNVGVNRV
jgi:hypothetical protein